MLTTDDMAHLARLARLAPEKDALARFGAQCADIISYMDILAEVDTTGTVVQSCGTCHAVQGRRARAAAGTRGHSRQCPRNRWPVLYCSAYRMSLSLSSIDKVVLNRPIVGRVSPSRSSYYEVFHV